MSYIKKASFGMLVASLMLTGIASPAAAQTNASLQDQVNALLATVARLTAQLQGGTSVGCTLTQNLTVGMTSAEVTCLQKFLNAKGYVVASAGAGSPGNETMYFGGLTRAALARFQAANGISPAVGYCGPITRAAINSMMAGTVGTGGAGGTGTGGTTTTTTTTSTTLNGGAGSVDDYSIVSGLSNEEVGEDANDVKVAGLEVEVDEGSDLQFTALRLVFNESTGATHDFEDYADEVSIWLGNNEVARLDADEFNDDNDWTQTVTLDNDAIIRKGDTGIFYVAISGVSNLDTADIGDDWTVDFDSIRFRDAQGASITEDPGTGVVTFAFESFATSADTELKITSGLDSVNEAHVINVDDSDDTDNVSILSFNMEVEGESDLTLESLTVTTTVTGAAHVDDVISGLSLWMDGNEVGNASVSSDCVDDTDCVDVGTSEGYLFDDLDLELEAGDDYDFLVKVDFLSTADDLDEGDTIAATVGPADVEAEDESGEDLAVSDISGTVNGEAHALYDAGFSFNLVSATASKTTGDPGTTGSTDRGTYTFVYDITAFDGDVSIDKSCVEDQVDAADQGTEYTVENEASDSCSVTSTADTNTNDSDAWVVEDGDTERFTMTVTATAADAFVRAYMTSINWDNDLTDTTPDLFYTFGLGQDETATSQLFLETY